MVLKRIFENQLSVIWKSAGWGEFPLIDSTTTTLDRWG